MIRMHRHLTVMRQALKADKALALFESFSGGKMEGDWCGAELNMNPYDKLDFT